MFGLGEKESKRVVGYVAVAGLALGWFLFMDEGGLDLFGGEDELMETTAIEGSPDSMELDISSDGYEASGSDFGFGSGTMSGWNSLESAPIEEESDNDSGVESFLTPRERRAFVSSLQPDVLTIEASPLLQAEAPWEALDRIATWYAVPSAVSRSAFLSYLTHRKLWVRLAALQFALSTAVEREELLALAVEQASDLVGSTERGQARRFLKRAEVADVAAFYRMKGLLSL